MGVTYVSSTSSSFSSSESALPPFLPFFPFFPFEATLALHSLLYIDRPLPFFGFFFINFHLASFLCPFALLSFRSDTGTSKLFFNRRSFYVSSSASSSDSAFPLFPLFETLDSYWNTKINIYASSSGSSSDSILLGPFFPFLFFLPFTAMFALEFGQFLNVEIVRFFLGRFFIRFKLASLLWFFTLPSFAVRVIILRMMKFTSPLLHQTQLCHPSFLSCLFYLSRLCFHWIF